MDKNESRLRPRGISRTLRNFAASIVLSGATPLALAQTALPPVFPAVDGNGVDVSTGNFSYAQTDVVIGTPGQGGLAYSLQWVGSSWYISNGASLSIAGTSCTVTIGTFVETFTSTNNGCTGTISSDQQQGSTLTAVVGGGYSYRTTDGTVALFDWEPGNGFGTIISITRPSGEVTNYNYEIGTVTCVPSPQNCLSQRYPKRITSIENNVGYRLVFEYPGSPDQGIRPSRVTGVNAAVEYCGGSNCTQSWPYATYTYDTIGNPSTSTNALGKITTFSYATPNGHAERLSNIQFPDHATHTVILTFDTNDRVQSVSLGFGSWSYAYADASGNRTTTVTNPDSTSRSYVSSIASGTVRSVTNEAGRTINYSYDSANRRTRVTLPEGNYIQYSYDSRGNITETRQVAKAPVPPATALADIVTSAVFPTSCSDASCNEPTSTTDARGYRTDYTYSTTHGGVTKITAPAPSGAAPIGSGTRPEKRVNYAQFQARYLSGPSTWVTGTAVWRPTGTSVCATGAAPACVGTSDETVTTLTYPSATVANNVQPTNRTEAAGNAAISSSNAMTYTSWGSLLTVDGPLSGSSDTTRYYYDAVGRQIGIVGPSPDGTANYRATRITLNEIGQTSVVERGTVTSQSDAAFSSFTGLEKHETVYDGYARPQYQRLWNGGSIAALTQLSYDNRGRTQCIAARMNSATFGSPPADACTLGTTGSEGPDRITKEIYNADGSVSSEQSAYLTPDAQTSAIYTYRANGQVETITDARGFLTKYTYDGFDRRVQVNYPDPASTHTSSTSDYEQMTFDAVGRLSSNRVRSGESFSYSYDNASRVTFRDAPGSQPDVTYGYDLVGHLVSQSESGNSVSTVYDALSRVTSVTSSVLGTVSYQYDPSGRRTRMTYPDGFYVTYGYNAVGDLTGEYENGSTQIVGFTHDGVGRRSTLTRNNGVTTSYYYDAASRLQTLTHDVAGTGYDNSVTFGYNPAGQITSRTTTVDVFDEPASASITQSFSTADGLNRYTTVSGLMPTYGDARGNLTGDGTRTYGFDYDNRLTSASGGVTLAYDPAGRLFSVAGSAGTTRFLYDGVDVIAEYDGSATPVLLRRYVHGPGQDEPLVWYEGAGTSDKHWLMADERGSVIGVTDGTGAMTQVNKYDVDGVPDIGNHGRFQFTGQMWIGEVALYHFKARAYHPGLGRFLQTDPIGFAAGLNLYGYADGDPINMTDPSGLAQSFGQSGCVWLQPYVASDTPFDYSGGCTGMDWQFRMLLLWSQYVSWPIMTATVGGGPGPPATDPPQKDPNQHHYLIRTPTTCPAPQAFDALKAPDVSAPGAPAAQEGHTEQVNLSGGNPISQDVNTPSMTIVNMTRPGHIFYPGTVTWQVSPMGTGSVINVTGEGTGAHAVLNDVVGILFFGMMSYFTQVGCDAANGIPSLQ